MGLDTLALYPREACGPRLLVEHSTGVLAQTRHAQPLIAPSGHASHTSRTRRAHSARTGR